MPFLAALLARRKRSDAAQVVTTDTSTKCLPGCITGNVHTLSYDYAVCKAEVDSPTVEKGEFVLDEHIEREIEAAKVSYSIDRSISLSRKLWPPQGHGLPAHLSTRLVQQRRGEEAVSGSLRRTARSTPTPSLRYALTGLPEAPHFSQVVLLGLPGSGKATLLKQLGLIYGCPEEIASLRENARVAIYLGLLQLVRTLTAKDDGKPLCQLLRLRLSPLLTLEKRLRADSIQALKCTIPPDRQCDAKSTAGELEAQSKLPSIALARTVKQISYVLSALYDELRQLFEANLAWLKDPYSTYLATALARLCSPTYISTDDDVLQARGAVTSGIEERLFDISDHHVLRLCTVPKAMGGRPVWSRYFEKASSLVYVIDTSSFDASPSQAAWEAGAGNRFEESLWQLRQICRISILKKVDIIVFLNKADQLKRKLREGADPERYLVGYKAPSSAQATPYKAVLRYMKGRVKAVIHEQRQVAGTQTDSVIKKRSRNLTICVTQMVDTQQISLVMEMLRETWEYRHFRQELEGYGLA